MKKIFTLTFLAVLASGQVLAQYSDVISKRGGTAAPFLGISMGASGTGMGSAFVAKADDPSAMYWNPAGLARLEGIQLMFDHTSWLADVNYNYFAVTYNMGDAGTIGFSYTASEYGDMEVTTIDEPDGNGQLFTAMDAVMSLAYAVSLTDKFDIGFNPKIIYQSVWNTSAMAVAIDIGVKYITPFDDMVLGMSITNFGTDMKLTGRSLLALYDPDPDNSGNNDKLPTNINTEEFPLPLTFRMGVSWNAYKSDYSRLTVAADAAHPNNDYESINLGGEYSYNEFLFLRGGYKSLFLTDTEEGFTFGAGVRQLITGNIYVNLNYAFADFGRLNNTQKVTLGLSF